MTQTNVAAKGRVTIIAVIPSDIVTIHDAERGHLERPPGATHLKGNINVQEFAFASKLPVVLQEDGNVQHISPKLRQGRVRSPRSKKVKVYSVNE